MWLLISYHTKGGVCKMAKKIFDEVQRDIYSKSPIGRAYLEYNEAVGGEPFGFSDSMPADIYEAVDTQYGGVVGLYHECIKQGKTWEELLDTTGIWDELPEE